MVIIPSFRTYRSEEQFDRSTLFIYFLYWKIASYTIKAGFFFYFLEMLRKKMDFTIKSKQSKKINNDQELIQSDPISCPQNQQGNN